MAETVLVLEDDKGISELIKRQLTRAGYLCELPDSIEAAMERLRSGNAIDLIIFDYHLNDRASGLEFYRDAVNGGFTGPAILITGFGNENVLLDALRSGVDDVLPKTPDFLEPLSLAVKRLLDERQRRRELEFLKSERKVHERVEAAFTAAHVSSWTWVAHRGVLHWTGSPPASSIDLSRLNNGELSDTRLRTLLGTSNWRRLILSLAAARKCGESFELELPIDNAGGRRWWLVRGAWQDGGIAGPSGIAMDVTERKLIDQNLRASMDEVQRLNNRLKFSITETHHRVKNSLQVVSSLLSMEARRGKGLDNVGLWRLMGHVRSLAALHDLLTDRTRDGRDLSGISVTDFLRSLEVVLKRLVPQLVASVADTPLELVPRRASSLAVVVTELVMNAAKYSEGTVEFEYLPTEHGYSVRVSNSAAIDAAGSPLEKDETAPGTGLELINTLLKSDFQTALQVTTNSERRIASFDLPRVPPPERPQGAFQ